MDGLGWTSEAGLLVARISWISSSVLGTVSDAGKGPLLCPLSCTPSIPSTAQTKIRLVFLRKINCLFQSKPDFTSTLNFFCNINSVLIPFNIRYHQFFFVKLMKLCNDDFYPTKRKEWTKQTIESKQTKSVKTARSLHNLQTYSCFSSKLGSGSHFSRLFSLSHLHRRSLLNFRSKLCQNSFSGVETIVGWSLRAQRTITALQSLYSTLHSPSKARYLREGRSERTFESESEWEARKLRTRIRFGWKTVWRIPNRMLDNLRVDWSLMTDAETEAEAAVVELVSVRSSAIGSSITLCFRFSCKSKFYHFKSTFYNGKEWK